MNHLPIFAAVERDIERGWDAFTSHMPHAHYHDPQNAATTPEAPMSLLDSVEADFEDVRAKVEEFATSKLPAALEDAKKLAGNPVVVSLLSAVHVPTEALSMVVGVIEKLEELYKPETDSPAPVVTADPAMGGTQPEPVSAPAS